MTSTNNQKGEFVDPSSLVSNTAASSSNNEPSSTATTPAKKHYHSKLAPTMVSVVEKQINDANMVHILPQPAPTINRDPNTAVILSSELVSGNSINKNNKTNTPNNTTSNTNNNSLLNISKPKDEDIEHPDDESKNAASKKSSNMDLMNTSTLTNPNITEMKLKKATNPSISSLRAMSLQGNYPTVSSTSTTLTKGSTRAEHFAAKLHDAIKSDTKNQKEDDETFVYETTKKTPPVTDQNFEIFDNASKHSGSNINKDSEKIKPMTALSDFNPNNSIDPLKVKEKFQNVFNPDTSPTCNKFNIDENFEIKSRSSVGSKKLRKKSFKNLHNQINDLSEMQPLSKIDNSSDNRSINQLRQITSRLFESNNSHPRRYSGNEGDINNNDSFEGDFDYYEPSLTNQYSNNNNNYNVKNNNHHNNDYDVNANDSDYDDELSNYFTTPYNFSLNSHNNNSNVPNLIKQTYNGSVVPDYGSIQGEMNTDQKNKWRYRSDIYNSPHDFTSLRAQRLKQIRGFCYSISIVFFLLFLGFISGFVLATNKELQSLKIMEVNNVIVSQEELVFDMIVSAFNPGLMAISINDVQIDIFAKTQFISGSDINVKSSETVLLGSIDKLEIPLYFQGGFLNRKKDSSLTEVKVLDPCSYDDNNGNHRDGDEDNDDGNNNHTPNKPDNNGDFDGDDDFEYFSHIPLKHTPDPRWLNISKNPFDLIVRGAMIYKLPFSSQNHTMSVSFTGYIDPNDYMNKNKILRDGEINSML